MKNPYEPVVMVTAMTSELAQQLSYKAVYSLSASTDAISCNLSSFQKHYNMHEKSLRTSS